MPPGERSDFSLELISTTRLSVLACRRRLAAFNKTGPDLATSENVAKLYIFFEGPNIRR